MDVLISNVTAYRPASLLNASHLVVTGGSAGGKGVFANLDYYASRLPNTTVVKGAPIGGAFFPGFTNDQTNTLLPPSDFSHWSAGQTGSIFETDYIMQLWDSYMSPACTAQHAGIEYVCASARVSYEFTQTPMMILQNVYDRNQIETQLGCPTNFSSDPAATGFAAYYGNSSMSTWTESFLKKGDGAFFPSCFGHTNNLGVAGNTTIPNQPNQTFLIGDWFWERGQLASHFVADSCRSPDGLPCNPTCNGIPSGNNCAAELKTLGCSTAKTAKLCENCARSHRAQLNQAGCTTALVEQLCESV